ncbi:hypothetical protein GWK47_038823 [Chionoecetes opilio]|uniref:Uncharacterized protein n=1 Tax=Chionoecetes opilio TaxID=41210 RepID=A0A8J5CYF7_CHIOP|nr:hypothetical protein GWK47_038823 [Chionoecetes opilio]
MAEACDVSNISIEAFLMGVTALEEELTRIPASLLHGPLVRQSTRLKQKEKNLSLCKSAKAAETVISEKTTTTRCLKRKKNEQSKEVQRIEGKVSSGKRRLVKDSQQIRQDTNRALLDISNDKENLQGNKRMKPVLCRKHKDDENSAVSGDTTSATEQFENNVEEKQTTRKVRPKRQRKINPLYGEHSNYELDESVSWLNLSHEAIDPGKSEAQRDTAVTNEAIKRTHSQKTRHNQGSKKATQTETIRVSDEKLKGKAMVTLELLNDMEILSLQRKEEAERQEEVNSGKGRTENMENTNKTANKKTKQQGKISTKHKKEKAPPKVNQSSQDLKITAKKGTLKYLQQREKYVEALASEVPQNEDFHDNPLFAKKKFKFGNLLPPSYEETLAIMTPKRNKNDERPEETAITPRTALLGQLQPVTPTTTPYSPFPTLDTNTKKDALREVYHMMKDKKKKNHRARKALKDVTSEGVSKQKVPFTLLALPEDSGTESDSSRDSYFSGFD